ncbi:hypothetical protein WA026_014525, partial [Henosepilachna vigintioctopunctata]
MGEGVTAGRADVHGWSKTFDSVISSLFLLVFWLLVCTDRGSIAVYTPILFAFNENTWKRSSVYCFTGIL